MEPTKYKSKPTPNQNSRAHLADEFRNIENATGALSDYVLPLAKSVHDFSGQYNEFFDSGYVAYIGPNGTLTFRGQLVFGTNIPNAAGVPNQPGLLIGGADGPVLASLTTDEQVPGKDGIDLIVSAGNTAVNTGNVQAAGDLLLFGGGALDGVGGTAKLQGGTSFNGAGGPTIVSGSNSTNEGGPRGSVFVQGGENGDGGGNVELIATGGTGTDGEIRFKFNSTLLWSVVSTGAVVFGAGSQTAGDVLVSQGLGDVPLWTTKSKDAAKTATTSRAGTTTVSDDPHLALSAIPAGSYEVNAYMLIGGVSAAGFKFRFSLPGGMSGSFGASGFANGVNQVKAAFAGNEDFTIATLSGGDLINGGANLTTTGTASVSGGGATWSKVGGSVAFDSAVYSNTANSNARIRCRPNDNFSRALVGLSVAQGLHANITRSFFFNSDGNTYIFEGGGSVATVGATNTGVDHEITYDGANARYYVNGALIRTVATSGADLYADSSFVDPGAQLNSVVYEVLNSTPDNWIRATGLLEVSSAGAIAIAWAQNTADAADTSVLKGFLTLRRIT